MRAVAAGISQANPFFKEDGKLGRDARLAQARPSGGVQASNSPGLYGGTPVGGNGPGGDSSPGQNDTGGATGEFGGSTKPGTCALAQLKKFLTAPENSAKAREWARVLHIEPDRISGYIDQLTPVVLRHDTLVTNHEYKHAKAVPFDALLQAGIAVLVDQQGLPAVKCSCGNPLRPSKANIKKTSVQFKAGNKKWSGFQQNHIVIVEPPPGDPKIDRLQLVDVHDPDHGIARELGVNGDDTSFNTHTEHAVPAVTGMTFAQATQHLAQAGLAMGYDGDSLPPDDAQVNASDPVEGSTLEWGAPVTLFVRSGDGGAGEKTPPDSGGMTTGPDESSTGPGESSTGPGESSTGPGESSTGPGESSTGPGESSTGPGESSTGPGESSTGPGESSTGPGGSSSGPGGSSTGSDTTSPTTPSASSSTPSGTRTSESATPTESLSRDPTSFEPTASGAPASSDSPSVDPGVSDSAPGAPSSATDAIDSGGLTADAS
ncbi:DUF6777 domain-containing protein [Streptomyces sp. NPDC048415]|uniref:DUF6777 domain-containing protein n=1 Tax=Streptomyces sp. NPDC048415 TaxID=3154822 RepID=UPI00343384E6